MSLMYLTETKSFNLQLSILTKDPVSWMLPPSIFPSLLPETGFTGWTPGLIQHGRYHGFLQTGDMMQRKNKSKGLGPRGSRECGYEFWSSSVRRLESSGMENVWETELIQTLPFHWSLLCHSFPILHPFISCFRCQTLQGKNHLLCFTSVTRL